MRHPFALRAFAVWMYWAEKATAKYDLGKPSLDFERRVFQSMRVALYLRRLKIEDPEIFFHLERHIADCMR
jgi:hypothetical protein